MKTYHKKRVAEARKGWEKLSAWEQGFIDNLEKKYLDRDLSKPQIHVLNQIGMKFL